MGDGRGGIACVRVLGAVQMVTGGGSVIDLPSASQRRLLALLALHAPRRLRSEWLADILGVSPGALRTTVSRLRSAIGADVLLTASTGYSLSCEVDASLFCQAVSGASDSPDRIPGLARALEHWTGPVLEEFQGEEWAEGEVARLTEIHAAAADDLAEELISAHRASDAVALLAGHVDRYPYRDRSRGLLIRALASAGRQAEALRAFQDYRTLLVTQLGTEPSPEVVRIERRVATGWLGIDREAGSQQAAVTVSIPLPGVLMRHIDFVGRRRELESLTGELAEAAKGGLRCVILEGEAGIGKTVLLAAFARSVTSTATVLYGRCDNDGPPLEPFPRLLEACVEHAPQDLLTDHVVRCGGELARMSPLLQSRVPTTPAPTRSDDDMERFLAFGAVADVLGRIAARQPLVLILDDVQDAEPTALLLLRHVAGALAAAPVLLVVSRRDPGDAVSDELRLALADLERGPSRRLLLTGFDDNELLDLVNTAANLQPSPAVTAKLREQTAGNPLYVSQVVRHWVDIGRMGSDDVPPSLRDVLWSRVHALGEEAADVLAAASVLGIDVHEDVLVDMVDLPEKAVRTALDAAAAAGLLVDTPAIRRSIRFVHALVANALYADVGPSTRAHLHARAARALEKLVEVGSPDLVVQLARHCALGGLAPDALHWSVVAGDQAFDHLAPMEAANHYRIAVEAAEALGRPDAERADLLVRLGHAEHRAGDPAALETLERGASLARRCGQREALIRAALAANRGFIRLDSGAPAYLAIVEAAVAAADTSDVATYSRLLALLAQCLMFTPNEERRLALARHALELAETAKEPALLAEVAPAALTALWAPGSTRFRVEVAAKALSAAEASGDPKLQFSATVAAYNVAVESADPVVAAHCLALMRSAIRRVGDPRLRWMAGICETFEATMAARFDEAEALAAANLELSTRIGERDAFAIFASQFFVLGTFAGRHEELLPLVEQAVRENPGMLPFTLAYGIVCAATGREETAQRILDEGKAKGFGDLPRDNIWMTSVIGYAVLAIELDDADAAAKLLPVIAPFAAEVAFNGITSQGPVGAYVGKLASLLGLHDLAEDHLRAALDLATEFGWTYHRATTLFALAQARHRRLGALDEEGSSWLAEASELCRAGGFRSWIPQIDALAAAQLRVTRG